MTVKYSLSQQTIGERKLYFAKTCSTGVVSPEEVVSVYCVALWSEETCVVGGIAGFFEVMEDELAMGRIVDWGEVGGF